MSNLASEQVYVLAQLQRGEDFSARLEYTTPEGDRRVVCVEVVTHRRSRVARWWRGVGKARVAGDVRLNMQELYT